MKYDIQDTKDFLESALKSLPGDFVFQGVRSHIITSINQISAIEHKRQQRRNTENNIRKMAEDRAALVSLGYQPWQAYKTSLPQAKKAIDRLDKLIQGEMDKIDEIKSKGNKNKNKNNNNETRDGIILN